MTTKYFTTCKTLDQLKKEYKRLAKIHHPDCGGDDATMAAINAEFDELCKILPKETMDGRTYQPSEEEREAPEKYRAAVAATLNMDGVTVELCGSWLWVTGNTYPNRDGSRKRATGSARTKLLGTGTMKTASPTARSATAWMKSA